MRTKSGNDETGLDKIETIEVERNKSLWCAMLRTSHHSDFSQRRLLVGLVQNMFPGNLWVAWSSLSQVKRWAPLLHKVRSSCPCCHVFHVWVICTNGKTWVLGVCGTKPCRDLKNFNTGVVDVKHYRKPGQLSTSQSIREQIEGAAVAGITRKFLQACGAESDEHTD